MKIKKKLSPEILPIHQKYCPKISSASETVQASNDDNLKTSACTWRLHRDFSSQPRFLASPLVVYLWGPAIRGWPRSIAIYKFLGMYPQYIHLYISHKKMVAKENHRLFLSATFGGHNRTVPRKVGISAYVCIYIYITLPETNSSHLPGGAGI